MSSTHPLDLLLKKIRKSSGTRRRDMGTAFERLVQDFLVTDSTQSSRYSKVQTYAQWAQDQGLSKEDFGIDLVAEKKDGSGFVAIQAKFYEPHRTLKKDDIDSFLSASSKKHFVERIVVDTTEGPWSQPAQKMLDNQLLTITRISLEILRGSDVDWNKIHQGKKAQTLPKFTPHPHQLEAQKAVLEGLKDDDRGHIVMACGSGKTFTALMIAQKMAGKGGRVLYLVPSLSLMSQSIQKWHQQSRIPITSFAVCSDSKVGKREAQQGDVPYLDTFDMVIPPTTNPEKLIEHFPKKGSNIAKSTMSVVFSTYQSLDVITQAQKQGLGEFDLMICDEAHRTTGATLAGKEEALFVRVHHNKYVQAKKRLYMTATPRIYGDNVKEQASRENALLASMDDEELFGKGLFVLSFGQAVELGLLTDYRVIILAMKEEDVSAQATRELACSSSELTLDDASKILGCFKALNKEWEDDSNNRKNPMRRALAFAKDIKTSKNVSERFAAVVDDYFSSQDPDPTRLSVEVEHVDGTFDSKKRTDLVSWLEDVPQDSDSPICRILSNARCLSEGVDIPALDGVIFLHPRKSLVDVVQSVGRVMRKAKGKEMGYVILPIGVPGSIEAHKALDQNKKYKVVWQILNALRSHDERLDATINQREKGQDFSHKIAVYGGSRDLKKMEVTHRVESLPTLQISTPEDLDIGGEAAQDPHEDSSPNPEKTQLPSWITVVRAAITAKIVERCGTREYWDDWAQSAAEIAQSHISRITGLIDPTHHPKNRKIFERFLSEIRDDLNESITESDAVEMLAQHIITRPIFQSLFSGRKFVDKNPVSKSMGAVLKTLDENGIHKESKDLSQFYHRVKVRSEGLTNPKAKQQLITELYEKFFAKAFPTTVEKLGIAYTPIEIVDFIIHSVNEILQSEFQGKTLGSPGVHILDPYTGTGSFITRLLESGLMSPEEIKRKYLGDKEGPEIHANEIVLLAYYIAAINIETAYQGVRAKSEEEEYAPFPGICLTDTFGLHEKDDASSEFFPENSKRRMYQKSQRVQVIMGNPPYSVGQKSANDNAANTKYDRLDERIEDTYVKYSKANLNKSLYNSYVRALRLGSDQINQAGGGVLAFITDAGWVESMGGAGIRHCVEQEFSKIYVFHLRGDARGSKEDQRREGTGVFGQSSRSPVAISFFISNGEKKNEKPAEIFFNQIGERLSGEEKRGRVMELKSLQGITALGKDGWRKIQPDEHGDWLNHRDPGFSQLLALGQKRGEEDLCVFENFSLGLVTNRDAWCYNPSRSQLLSNMKRMIAFYNKEVERLHSELNDPSVAEIKKHASRTDSQIKWTHNLYQSALRGTAYELDKSYAVISSYRPFTKNWLYYDRSFNERVYQIPKIFPLDPESPQGTRENEVIVVSGLGSTAEWSCLITNALPNLDIIQKSQCFPRYLYDPDTLERREAITDAALEHFQKKCQNSSITKEQIFYYIYGVFHSEKYRSRFAVNLKKELARVPVVDTYKEFKAFSDKGRELAELHLDYEKAHSKLGQWCPGVEIEEKSVEKKDSDPVKYYRVIKMKFPSRDDETQIIYNAHITIKNIPEEAYSYVVNGRPAIEWVMLRQKIKTDNASGITKDPNAYGLESGDPEYLLNLLLGVIAVSVRTGQLVKALPELRWSEEKTQTEIINQNKEELSAA